MGEIIPTARELEALKVLWQCGEATVHEICQSINAKGERLAYTTVLSLLQVMQQKGLVRHRRAGKAYVYAPTVEREKTCRTLAGEFLHRVFDGAVDEYVVHMLDSCRPDLEELDQLEKMIAEAKEDRHGRSRRKGSR